MAERVRVAAVHELPVGTAKHVEVGGVPIAVFNVDGTIYATGGACTHKGGPLGEGDLDDAVVTCPWHGAQFDVTTGRVVGPPAARDVPTYRVVVEGDDVHLQLD